MRRRLVLAGAFLTMAVGCSHSTSTAPTNPTTAMGFFVTSTRSATANLGGLRGADAMCQGLAATAGVGNRTWHAYLSVERDATGSNAATDARSRIGAGPWLNANHVMVARDLTELHARKGDAAIFVDERGQMIPGQWTGSPAPVEHDILTGSRPDGTLLPGMTCADWTSSSSTAAAQVGHSDGFGPNQDTSGTLSSWNSAHANQSCADTAPRGGAGRLYCFAID